ncbi:MAG: DUF6055 domain-containing protein [Candidatus Bathyarchaeia archaeon]
MRVSPLIIMFLTLFGLQLLLVAGILCQVPEATSFSISLTNEEEEYLVRDAYYRLDDPKIHRAASEHFQVIWGDGTKYGKFTEEMAEGVLCNLERIWDIYINKLGFREPTESWNPSKRDGKKYKVNLYVIGTLPSPHDGGGYYMGSDPDDFGIMLIDPTGLRADPPSWVLPHEFAHVLSAHQSDKGGWAGGNPWSGPWWEMFANWMREQYLLSENYEFKGKVYGPETGLSSASFKNTHLFIPHGRNYYDCWMLFQYFYENPDGLLGLGKDFPRRLWQEALPNEYPFDTIQRLLAPYNISLKDLLGYYARRMATLDFAYKDLYRRKFEELNRAEGSPYGLYFYTELEIVPDKPGWWRVPMELAPQQTGYNVIPLKPEGTGDNRTIIVEFMGLVEPSRGSDWRVCLVVEDDYGNTRYSSLWNNGTNSITLSANENKVYLVVVATPDRIMPVSAFQKENECSFKSSPEKARFPYEVRIIGATPIETTPSIQIEIGGMVANRTGRRHPNGGGFVEITAYVEPTAYVGPNAMVLDRAKVLGNARILDYAVVKDYARVEGNAIVSGHAVIKDNAVVKDYAKVRDYALVGGNAIVSGHARVLEHAVITDRATITDYATAKGAATVFGDAVISGEGIIDGDYADSTKVSRGVAFGWLQGQDYANTRPFEKGLYVAYDFSELSAIYALDKYGVTHGILRGNPSISSGKLRLNGVNQYILLDDSLLDFEDILIEVAVKWEGGEPEQRIFSFGPREDKCMYLTPSNSEGKAEFVIINGLTIEKLTYSSALPINQWVKIKVYIKGNIGRLYINDTLVDEREITLDPDDLIEVNTNSVNNCNYLGRGVTENYPYFKGEIDYFRAYLDPDAAAPKTFLALLETYRTPIILCGIVISLIILALIIRRHKSSYDLRRF